MTAASSMKPWRDPANIVSMDKMKATIENSNGRTTGRRMMASDRREGSVCKRWRKLGGSSDQ